MSSTSSVRQLAGASRLLIMRVDRSHRPWIVAAVLTLALSTAAYVPYASSVGGARGGRVLGLVYGVSGYLLIIFAGLLGVRKKFRARRFGRAQTWMRGHLWLGLLSLPLILFHAGFAFRGPLTFALMMLLVVVIGSGIVGAVLQHFLPTIITREIQMETIHEEIPSIRAQLIAEADKLVTATTGNAQPLLVEEVFGEEERRFSNVYVTEIRPYLENAITNRTLDSRTRSAELFASLRRLLPPNFHSAITDLEGICEENREVKQQQRFHSLLHAWLVVHAPLAIALIVLAGIHAFVAMQYR